MAEKSQIVKTVKKVTPCVISITVSKYLPIYENPFKSDPLGFEDFFAVPKRKKKIKVGGGSGFIVDKSGIVLSNRHVVIDPDADYVAVLDNGEKAKVKVLARDSINDIAILRINKKNLPTLKLGDSSNLDLGQTAIAIGNTLGTFQNTISRGVVSGLSRKIKAVNIQEKSIQSLKGLIQTDAAINPGNSGGPLVDIKGEVIGINAATVSGAENVGFAIPVNAAKKDLEDLKQYGKIRQPFLGIRYIPICKEIKQKYSLPVSYGVLILPEQVPGGRAVIANSPAEKAGLRTADIILKIKNKKVTDKNPFEDILQECKVGEEIVLNVFRNNKEILLMAILADKK